MTAGAQASSFVSVPAPVSTPSVVRLVALEPVKAAEAGTATPSVVALGGPLPDVTYEKVAAIPDQPRTGHGSMEPPMIIRGGIVGSAFVSPSPAKAAYAPATPAAATPVADGRSGSSKPQPPTATASQPAAASGKTM